MTDDQINQLRQLCKQSGINYLGIFGSFARGDHNQDSDVDLLARYVYPLSLLEKGRVINSFKDILGREIDLVSEKHLKPQFRPYVEKDLKVLYEER